MAKHNRENAVKEKQARKAARRAARKLAAASGEDQRVETQPVAPREP